MQQSSYHEREYGLGGLSVTLENFLDFQRRRYRLNHGDRVYDSSKLEASSNITALN